MALNKPNNEIDTSTLAQESTSQEIKLSNESIEAVADEILSRVGLTNDTGGGTSEGSVFAKLNALLTQTTGTSGGTKILVPSEKALYIDTNSYESYQSLTNIFSFTPKYDGVLKVCAEGRSGHSDYYAYVKINNQTVCSFNNVGGSSDSFFKVTKNTKYTVSVQNNDSTSRYHGTISNIRLLGEVISKNMAFNEF